VNHDPDRVMKMAWADIESLADEVFHVWSGQPELKWAKCAWDMLDQAGLTAYRNAVQKYAVQFRLLVLSGIYSDFCDRAFDEPSEIGYSMEFELDRFVGGQLWARRPDLKFDDELDDDGDILNTLVETHRGEVVRALVKGFGSDTALYASLWKSKDANDADADQEDGNDDTFVCEAPQGRAYEWVSEGCQRLH
jgi:hypothetical protein